MKRRKKTLKQIANKLKTLMLGDHEVTNAIKELNQSLSELEAKGKHMSSSSNNINMSSSNNISMSSSNIGNQFIYVSGPYVHKDTAWTVCQWLRALGYKTSSWADPNSEFEKNASQDEKADLDFWEVMNADAFLWLASEGSGGGMFTELGIALACDIPIIAVDIDCNIRGSNYVFGHHDRVQWFTTISGGVQKILRELEPITETAILDIIDARPISPIKRTDKSIPPIEKTSISNKCIPPDKYIPTLPPKDMEG